MTESLTLAERAWLDDELIDVACRAANDAARHALLSRPSLAVQSKRTSLRSACELLRQRAVMTLGAAVARELFGDIDARPLQPPAPFGAVRTTSYARRFR